MYRFRICIIMDDCIYLYPQRRADIYIYMIYIYIYTYIHLHIQYINVLMSQIIISIHTFFNIFLHVHMDRQDGLVRIYPFNGLELRISCQPSEVWNQVENRVAWGLPLFFSLHQEKSHKFGKPQWNQQCK